MSLKQATQMGRAAGHAVRRRMAREALRSGKLFADADIDTIVAAMDAHRQLRHMEPGEALAERDTPFQQVIDVLDQCQLAGFERTELKLLAGQVRKQREGDRQ